MTATLDAATGVIEVADGERRVRPLPMAIARAQAIPRRYGPEGSSRADELIADRRREAEREWASR